MDSTNSAALEVILARRPLRHAVFTGVVCSQSRFRCSEGLDQTGQIARTKLQIVTRIGQARARISYFQLARQLRGGLRHHLHQSHRARARHRIRFKRGLLANQPGHKHGVQLVARRRASHTGFVGERKCRPPGFIRNFRHAPRLELRKCLAHRHHTRRVMSGGDRGSGRIDQKFWRMRLGIRGSIFKLGRGIECDIAERSRARLPLLHLLP